MTKDVREGKTMREKNNHLKALILIVSICFAFIITGIKADAGTGSLINVAENKSADSSGGEGAGIDIPSVEETGIQNYNPGSVSNDDAEELFEKYIEETGGKKSAPKLRSSAGGKLSGVNRAIYAKLTQYISQVAAGDRDSTVFEVKVEEYGLDRLTWTASELGVDAIVVNNAISDEAKAAVRAKGDFDLSRIVHSLLADNPYALYWYDKTVSTNSRKNYTLFATYDHSAGEYVITLSGSAVFSFPVAEEYSSGEYVFNTEIGKSVQTIVDNANAIVTKYTEVSDYEKLDGYRQEICDLVSYNDDAAEGDISYGNPWQLIWVFDNDPDTNVVCEGYAKAFHFLCNLTEFYGDIDCITVTGILAGGTGSGSHMWNVVTMENGKNYLADVTNCDEDTIGADRQLFLVGFAGGSVTSGYTFKTLSPNNDEYIVSYEYSEESFADFSNDELAIAGEQYVFIDNGVAEFVEKGIKYSVSSGAAKVTGYRGRPVDLIIPDKIADIPVTTISGDAFDKCQTLKTIQLPASLKVIEDGSYDSLAVTAAFSSCESLTSVTFADNSQLEYLGAFCFYQCKQLVSINFPPSLRVVAESCFNNCESLKAIVFLSDDIDFDSNAFAGYETNNYTIISCEGSAVERKIKDLGLNSASLEDKAKADETEKMIRDIPAVLSAADEKIVNDVNDAVAGLTEDQKKLISNQGLLKVENAKKAMTVIKLIVSMDAEDSAKVTAARKAYNSLTNQQKQMIATAVLNMLVKAEENLKEKDTAVIPAEVPEGKPAGKPAAKPVLVSRIKLSGISNKVAAGKKIRLTAKVLPGNAANKKLKWTVSNKKYAVVNQKGVVTINKKAGGKSVKITAKAMDGSGKNASWNIKIMKGAVKKITVKGLKKTLKAGKTMQLKAVVKTTKGKPVNKKLKWTSLNTKWATVTQKGKVKAKPAGKGKTVKIKVTSTDGTGKTVIKKIKIK